jgi:hypothetical protein
MQDFREVLSYCDLHDLGFFCLPWTYNNKQAGERNVKVRLDRAVANLCWSEWFPEASVQHIVSSRSDHCPLFLDLEHDKGVHKSKQIMRYEIMWEREESLPMEIKTAWEGGTKAQSLGDIAHSLGRVMVSLRKWSSEKFGSVTKELNTIRKGMEELSSSSQTT